jgi:SAM-dependent methyltransferase
MDEKEQAPHTYDTFVEKGEIRVIDCRTCGFKHIFPLPSESYLREYYNKSYSDPLEKINIETIFSTISKALASNSDKKTRKALDLGAGDGTILEYFKGQGWITSGIEPHPDIGEERCKTLGIIKSSFEEVEWDHLRDFDAVLLSFVLEHLRDPKTLLSRAYEAMSPGAIIYMEVPNDFNALQETIHEQLGLERWWIVAPDHLNYFNSDSLTHLAEQVGFSTLLIESSFPVEMFVLMGENYIGNPTMGKKIHRKRLEFEHHLRKSGRNSLRREIYRKLIEIGIGRSIIYYGMK